MRKILLILITILLTACSYRQDYYELQIDDYSIVVGYDNDEYMSSIYEYSINDELQANQTIEKVDLFLMKKLFASADFTNESNKVKNRNKAILTKIVLYTDDLKGRTFKINSEQLSESVKTNCDKYNGKYITKNGCACVIENKVKDKLNVIELYGDYLNLDQDKLSRIEIYVK